MKIEQNISTYGLTDGASGYIDLARGMSALNGKSIAQTKRSKGKYKPLGFLIRIRAITGTITVDSLNCGYPTRNSVVLAGHARDEMLKSAGVSRSNLETYQKELRLRFDGDMTNANTLMPGQTDFSGTLAVPGWGDGLVYDYTQLVIEDPASPGDTLTKEVAVLGRQNGDSSQWDADDMFYTVSNWFNWRHSLTPAAADDDIQNNIFSWAIQQSDTAEEIANVIDDEADEKPYQFSDFTTKSIQTQVGTGVGNPTSMTFCAPLGLLKFSTTAAASWEIEIVGVTEL